MFGILYKKIAAARQNLERDNEMDDIEEVFELRFDDARSWTRPPLPADAEAYYAEVRQGIDGCLDKESSRSHMPNCREVVRLIASDELADVAWLSRALVRFHLLRCRDCRAYRAQL